jgi:hypothetical protein
MVVGMPLRARQPARLVGEGQPLHSLISIRHVAAFTTAAVGHPAAINQRLALGGPEPLSWRGIVDTFGKILGQDLPVQFVAPGEPIPGLPELLPPVLAGMETYDSPIPMEETARTFGVEQTTLGAVARDMLSNPVVWLSTALMALTVDQEQPTHRSHLFTLRLWREGLGDGRTDWRGKVRHVTSGETRYFRDWPALQAFLQEVVLSIDAEAAHLDETQVGDSSG